jgi:hypothetical protein
MSAQPPPAFPGRPGCDIPYIPQLDLSLVQDCSIPLAPDPIYEAPDLEPIIPPPDIGCPPINLDIVVDPLKQEYDWTYANGPDIGVKAIWTKTAPDAGLLSFEVPLLDPPSTVVYDMGVVEPTTPYTAPIEITETATVSFRVFIDGVSWERYLVILIFQDGEAPEDFFRLGNAPKKYDKPLPLVDGYAKFETVVSYRDDDYCAPEIDVKVEVPEFLLPCPRLTFNVGEQKVWDKPHVEVKIEDKPNSKPGCDFDFDINVNIPSDCVLAQNITGGPVLINEPLEIVGEGIIALTGEHYVVVDRPSADDVDPSKIVFPIGEILSPPDYDLGCVHGGIELLLVDYDGADPIVDNTVGVVAGSNKFKADNKGFKVLAVDPVNKKVWIRPEGGGGGGVESILGVVVGGCNPGPNTFNKIQVFDDGTWSAIPDPLITGYILDRY